MRIRTSNLLPEVRGQRWTIRTWSLMTCLTLFMSEERGAPLSLSISSAFCLQSSSLDATALVCLSVVLIHHGETEAESRASSGGATNSNEDMRRRLADLNSEEAEPSRPDPEVRKHP